MGVSARRGLAAVLMGVAVLGGACADADDDASGAGAKETAGEQAGASKQGATAQTIGLEVAPGDPLAKVGALNPTTAVDPKSGAVFAAWARELPTPEGSKEDPALEAVVARSEDGGQTFSAPVVVSEPGQRIVSYTVSPTQVEVGPDGTVFVLYLGNIEAELPGYDYGYSYLQLARSDDGGKTFSKPVAAAPEATEGLKTAMEMATLFVAPDNDVYISFLDFRHQIQLSLDELAGKAKAPETGGHGSDTPVPDTELRMVRSADGGRTFAPSTLVSKPTCGCCGTKVAQGKETPVFATTRSDWKELKGSKDSVRDPFLSVSPDEGKTWGAATKIHDDGFKISGCPDVNAGLSVDSRNRLHAAWYTGTEKGPGIWYSISEDDGKTFAPPTALMEDDWVPYGDVNMVLDTEDRAWVVYEDRRGDVDKIQVVRIDPGGKRVYTEAWTGTAPDISTDGERAFVVWAQPSDEHGARGPVEFAVVTPGDEQAASAR